MIDKEFIAYFKLAHGFFNLCMMALFCYQGWMGFLIRQARTSGTPMPLDTVRRHRKAGPVFALWGVVGYIAGIVVVVLDKGRVFEYPLHFLTGSVASRSSSDRGLCGLAQDHGRGTYPPGIFISAWACSCLRSMSSRSCWVSAFCSDALQKRTFPAV